MWQHVKLSVQIRPWDTLACCWDDKQPTNKQLWQGNHSEWTWNRETKHATYVSVRIGMCIWHYGHTCLYIGYVYGHKPAYLFVCLCTHICVFIGMWAWVCLFIYIFICVHAKLYIYVCRPAHLHKYECSCTFIHIYTCTNCICIFYMTVQCCEDTVGVKMHWIPRTYCYHYHHQNTQTKSLPAGNWLKMHCASIPACVFAAWQPSER